MEENKGSEKIKWCNIILNIVIIVITIVNLIMIYVVFANIPLEVVLEEETKQVIFSNTMKVMSSVGILISCTVCIYPFLALKKIIKSIKNNDIFSSINLKRLKRSIISMSIYIGLNVFGIIGMTKGKLSFMHNVQSINMEEGAEIGELTAMGFGINLDFNLLYLLSVVIFIVVLIEIIKAGKILKEENDLMI